MPIRGRRIGSNATALQEPPQTKSSGAATAIPESTIGNGFVETAATVKATESEISTVAYQLWLDNGCPAGSDREDWLRAEAMLNSALVAKGDNLSRRPPIPRYDTGANSEILVELRWEGHWEVWEREWGGARWIWD
jgi:hypothetical protein